jgi:hypothetical protein
LPVLIIMKWAIGSIIVLILGLGLFLFLRRSLPYASNPDILSAEITIDSTWTLGPAAGIYDRRSEQYYWLKYYRPVDLSELDTLKGRKVRVKYTKVFIGPLENKISRMEADSVLLFDQVIE